MGVLEPCGRQLAPLNGVVPHVGLSIVRFKPVGTSFDQRGAARPQRGAGLRVAATDDGRKVAESVGGGVFAVHPLRVESVAWVSERKDVLSGFFGLLALIAYARYAKARAEPKGQKPNPVGQPCALSDLRLPSSILLSSIPVPLRPGLDEQADAGDVAVRDVAAGLLAAGKNAECGMQNAECSGQQHATHNTRQSPIANPLRPAPRKDPVLCPGGVGERRGLPGPAARKLFSVSEGLPLGARVGNALISYCRYLGKLFWPAELAVFYPHPGFWPLGKVLLAGGLVLGISVLVWARRRHPYLLVGWLWFFGMLVPVIGLVQTGAKRWRTAYVSSITRGD